MDITELRSMVQEKIGEYYRKEHNLYDVTFRDAKRQAQDGINGALDKLRDQRIANLETAVLKGNSGSGSMFLDIVFSIITVFGPTIIGHLAQAAFAKHKLSKITKIEEQFAARMDLTTPRRMTYDIYKKRKLQREQHAARIESESKRVKRTIDLYAPWVCDVVEAGATDVSNRVRKMAMGESTEPKSIGPTPVKPNPYSSNLTKVYPIPYKLTSYVVEDISKDIDNYLEAMIKTSADNETFHKQYLYLIDDIPLLQAIYGDWQTQIDSGAVTDTSYKDNLRQIIEGIMWIYYLGNPSDWMDYRMIWAKGGYFNFILDRYPIPQEEATDKEFLKAENIHVSQGLPQTRWLIINIPYLIFERLIDRFGAAETGVSFYQQYFNQLVAAQKDGKISWNDYIVDKSHYHQAGIAMKAWFVNLYISLTQSEEEVLNLVEKKMNELRPDKYTKMPRLIR